MQGILKLGLTCEQKLVIQIAGGEVQKIVAYYMCSSENYKSIVGEELKGKK